MKNVLPPRREDHPSLRRHRKQFWLQIMLPVLLAAAIMVGLVALLVMATTRGQAELTRWSAISAILLSLPAVFGGVVLLVVVAVFVYLGMMILRYVPRYSYQAQRVAYQIEGGTRRLSEMARRPILAVQGVGSLIKLGFQRFRERI